MWGIKLNHTIISLQFSKSGVKCMSKYEYRQVSNIIRTLVGI